jgi:hypothetical protein
LCEGWGEHSEGNRLPEGSFLTASADNGKPTMAAPQTERKGV